MVLDRYRIAKGLVGPREIVFDKPISEVRVEAGAIRCHVPECNELILKRAVEPLLKGIVRRRLGTGEVVGQRQRCCRRAEVPRKLAAVVRLDVFNASLKKVVDAAEEVRGMAGTMTRIHTRKSDLGVGINAGQDIAFYSSNVPYHRIQRHKEVGSLFFLELGNAFFDLIVFSFLP